MNYKFLVVASMSACVSASALGQYAANTFGPGPTWNAYPNGYFVDGGGVAFRFQALNSGVVTNITAAVADYNAGDGILPIEFNLWTDSGAGSPTGTLGTALSAGWTTSTSGLPWNTAVPISVNILGGPSVTAGQWYWITGQALPNNAGSITKLDWAESPTTFNPFNYILDSNVITPDGAPTGAYSVKVNAVPEPMPYLALGLGVIGLLARRTKQTR